MGSVAMAVAVLGGFAVGQDVRLGLLLVGIGLSQAALFGTVWCRAAGARRNLRTAQPRRVTAVGWCRPPDGCNYALFFGDHHGAPDATLRLPLRREMVPSTVAWTYGALQPSLFRGVALVGPSGLLAHGRIVTRDVGRKRWARRSTEPPAYVVRPPDGWLPPAGS